MYAFFGGYIKDWICLFSGTVFAKFVMVSITKGERN